MDDGLRNWLGSPLSEVQKYLKERNIGDFTPIEASAPSLLKRADSREAFARSDEGEKLGLSEKRVIRIDTDTETLIFARFLTASPLQREEINNE